jgi:hypothetical protein
MYAVGCQLAEVAPARGDDEKPARERERDACDDRPGGAMFELRDLRRGEPDPSEQDEQESGFREAHARLTRQSEGVHARHSSCPAPPVSRQGVAAATPELRSGYLRVLAIGQQRVIDLDALGAA